MKLGTSGAMPSMNCHVTQTKRVMFIKCFNFSFLFLVHILEVLFEPMRKYIVKEVTQEDTLKIVRLEPQKAQLLLEDKIPSGCIQHIISSLSKQGRESVDICDKMCRVLCSIDLGNDSSRK